MERYITIKEVASILGICKETVRNWGRKGYLKHTKHPVNRYRLYDREEVLKLKKRIGG